VGHVACMGDRRGACRVLVDRPEGNGLFRCKWEKNIKMDLQELGWVGMDWIDQAQDRDRWHMLVNVVTDLGVP